MLGGRPTRFYFFRSLRGIVLALFGRPSVIARRASQTFDRPLETALGREFAAQLARQADVQPGCSAFQLLEDGAAAFLARVALVRRAERAVDLQYYIYEGDRAGSALACEVLRAAERGVRVRILLDDSGIGFRDRVLGELDSHRNVEVRVFNPTVQRDRVARVVEFVTRISRLNRRMHNKILAVDGAAAIIGGRNIGDHYFGATLFGALPLGGRVRRTFRDFDVLMQGPAAAQAGASFDLFWNSEHAVPVRAFHDGEMPEARAVDLLARLGRSVARVLPEPTDSAWRLTATLHWAVGEVVGERPEHIADAAAGRIVGRLAQILAAAEREVLIESAYFVPQENGVGFLASLVRAGVAVTVLTNALASSDVPAVHSGYARYRRALLEAGVALREFRRRPRGRRWSLRKRSTEQETSLHAKVLVVDRRVAWVGSFNMDPRSARLNTEVGVLIHSASFATELAGFIDSDIAPEHSWRLALEADGAGGRQLTWSGMRNGQSLRLTAEPDTGGWAKAKQAFFQLLPGIEALL